MYQGFSSFWKGTSALTCAATAAHRGLVQDHALLPHQISLSAEKEMIRRMQRQAEIVEALGLMDETPKQ